MVSPVFEGFVDGCGLLTGGGGLSGIDVADNDHVDVHLFLTAEGDELAGCPLRYLPPWR
jgi:hypothetical protein